MPQKSYYETNFFGKKKEFVGEVWWPIKETGRLVPYPGDSWIIPGEWHYTVPGTYMLI